MSTGYFYADWRQGGAVPGRFATTAGAMLTILDYLLTTGSSPWVKTVTGTNQAKYKAPGGSQIEIEVEDNYALASSIYARVTAVVGAITFPTVAQRTNVTGTMGHVVIRKGASTSQPYGWYGVRTDRMFLLVCGGAATTTGGVFHVFGDLPVIDPADPGLCVSIGSEPTQTTFPKTSASNGGFAQAATGGLMAAGGYCSVNKTNTIQSVQAYVYNHHSSQQYSSLNIADYGGMLPRYPACVFSYINQTGSGSPGAYCVPRGYIPFLYGIPMTGSISVSGVSGMFRANDITSGDTFTDGSDTFEAIAAYGSSAPMWALMTNDGEPLP